MLKSSMCILSISQEASALFPLYTPCNFWTSWKTPALPEYMQTLKATEHPASKSVMAAWTALSLKKPRRPLSTVHMWKAWHWLFHATSASDLTQGILPGGVGRSMLWAGIVLHGQLWGGKFETAEATWKSRSNWETWNVARSTGCTCHSPGSWTLASLSPSWHQLREHRPLTSKSRNRFTLPAPWEEQLHLNKLARLRSHAVDENCCWLPLLTKAEDKSNPGFLIFGPLPRVPASSSLNRIIELSLQQALLQDRKEMLSNNSNCIYTSSFCTWDLLGGFLIEVWLSLTLHWFMGVMKSQPQVTRPQVRLLSHSEPCYFCNLSRAVSCLGLYVYT